MFNAKSAFLAALVAIGGTLSAATPPATPTTDVYQVNYFLGLRSTPCAGPNNTGCNVPNNNDAQLVILDPGTNPAEYMCADIYVLNPSEEMEACCSCKITPDEIIVGSVVQDLLANLLNGNGLSNGVLKIIASKTDQSGQCRTGETPTPVADLRAWLTRVDSIYVAGQQGVGTSTGVTTTRFADAPLSPAEFNTLASTCSAITQIGSGFGQCYCPMEPPDHISPP